MAGFECSSHRRPDGVRLDLLRSTRHDSLALGDYRACRAHGIRSARDGLRWHRIEIAPGTYDWSSWIPMLEAAAEAGLDVIWDLLHYGSPDFREPGDGDFPDSFAAFAAEAARVHRAVTGAPLLALPINEISFFTWAVRTGYFPKSGPDEPGWFKRRLVRSALAAAKAMREADAECRFFWAEPLIHVTVPRGLGEEEARAAQEARLAQFEAFDMLLGRTAPELGGGSQWADAIGLNFYPDNQWYHLGSTLPLGHFDYRPLSDMLVEVWERYRKPIFLSETGAEGSARAAWLHYVCDEVREAMGRGVDFRGVCLYPVTTYPGWDDDRDAEVGLFSTAGPDGTRRAYRPLADELERQRALLEQAGVGADLDLRLRRVEP